MIRPKYVASCSGGKDSVATLLLAAQHNEPLDEAVFSEVMFDKNTSGEVPEHRDFIYDRLKPFCEKELGIKFTILHADKTYDEVFHHVITRGPHKGEVRGFAWAGMCAVNRDCKIPPVRKYNAALSPDTVSYVGIAEDEPKRLARLDGVKKVSLLAKYGMTEADFLSAELCCVPAFNACDIGFDRSFVGAYGHDDRVCSYPAATSLFDLTETPAHTGVCLLVDKEEIGSDGVTGMQSRAFDTFMADLCRAQDVLLDECFENSVCLSADVCNAFDPNYPDVSEKRNDARANCGFALVKYTGARGKSGTSDATAELMARIRCIFDKAGVIWQTGQLGKVDQGGGGTVAMYLANRNIDTVDAGVPVLSMHAPFECIAKLDLYMAYKGFGAFYRD